MAPVAGAQQPAGPVPLAAPTYAQRSAEPATAVRTAPAEFVVFFGLDEATLTPDGRRVVAEAAEAYQERGAARIAVTGHADRSGSEAYNLALSERRADAVARELVRLGVPAAAIATVGQGETNPLVPTADGVREPRNRRVEIEVPRPPTPPPAPPPVAAAPPEAAPEPAAGPPPLRRWAFSLGGLYGYNFGETDDGKESQLAGVEGRIEYLLTPNLPISIEQTGFRSFNSDDDGYGGRSVIGIDLQGNFGGWHPYIGANFGGVYGKGVQDGLVAGPEVGMKLDLSEAFFLYGKAAYDYQFRNDDWDEGIASAGLGFGWRF